MMLTYQVHEVLCVPVAAVEPKNSADLPKLVEGKEVLLSRTSWFCATPMNPEHIIAKCLRTPLETWPPGSPQNDFMGTEVKVSDPLSLP
jgi:hypothetical protein